MLRSSPGRLGVSLGAQTTQTVGPRLVLDADDPGPRAVFHEATLTARAPRRSLAVSKRARGLAISLDDALRGVLGCHPTSDLFQYAPEIRVRSHAHSSICVQKGQRINFAALFAAIATDLAILPARPMASTGAQRARRVRRRHHSAVVAAMAIKAAMNVARLCAPP